MTHLVPSSAVLLALAVVLDLGCNRRGSNDEDGERHPDMGRIPAGTVTLTAAQISHGEVRWATPALAAMSERIEVPGQLTIDQDRSALLAAPAQGRVIAVHVNPGQRVARGARLVSLQSGDANAAMADVSKAAAEVASRRAGAVYARSARERAERLLALKAIPRQDYERAVADDELARSSLEQAEAELARARSVASQLGVNLVDGSMSLLAPIAGVVTTRDAVPGTVVAPGAPLVTVTDPSSLWLSVALPEHVAAGVRVGASLRFTVAAYPGDTLTARVESVSATFDPTTRTLPVRALVDNRGGRLRPAMFARVWLEGGQTKPLPLVPSAAVQRIDGKAVVFVAHPEPSGGARFDRRDVELGRSSGDRVAIVRGIDANELVVVEGAVAVKSELLKNRIPMEMD